MPPVSRDELLALIESGVVAGDEDLKVVGMRNFPSDESWAPVRDYPETARFFGTTGRAQIKAEVDKAKKSRFFAFCAIGVFLLGAFLFWWNPYVDAKDSAGQVARLEKKQEAAEAEHSQKVTALKAEVLAAQQKSKGLEAQLSKLRSEMTAKEAEFAIAMRDREVEAAVAGTLASSDKALRAEVAILKNRIEQLNDLPKFWPGADALKVPDSEDEVRLVSVLPENGYLYVIGLRSYPADTIVTLDQPGFFGVKIFAKVVNSYPHAGGGKGMSLHVPDVTAVDSSKIHKLKLGESLKCSALNAK